MSIRSMALAATDRLAASLTASLAASLMIVIAMGAAGAHPALADSGAADGSDLPAGTAALDQWLERQADIDTWSADVLQIRSLKSLSKPLKSSGHVWFEQPNRFRWELGNPPSTIAVRAGDQLVVAYPRLGQVEHYVYGEQANPALRQAMALLEVGLPANPQAFHDRYELLDAKHIDTDSGWRFELRPRNEAARQLIERMNLEVSTQDSRLLATELVFPDGSTMRNEFSHYEINPKLPDDIFNLPSKAAPAQSAPGQSAPAQ